MFERRVVAAVFAIQFLCPHVVDAAVLVEHPDFGFSLELPDGFERVEADERADDFVRVYRNSNTNGQLSVVFAVERLKGVLPRDDFPAKLAKSKWRTTLAKWGEFDVVVVSVTDTIDNAPAIVLNAQVPLKPEAVQLKLIGPAAQEPQLIELMQEVLGSLQGQSNWLTAEQRADRATDAARGIGISLAVLAIIGLVVWKATQIAWRRVRGS